jgi:DNA polymerase III subunit delta
LLRLYFGDDQVSLDQAVSGITGKVDAALVAINVQRLDGTAADLRELAAACRSLPFLGASRVIVVTSLSERLKSAPKEATAFAEALRLMPPSTELILVEPDLQGEGTGHPLYSQARQGGEVRRFSLGGREDIEDWIAQRAADGGVGMTHDACIELAKRVGANALQLQSELDKLATYAMGQGPIDVQQVRELVPASDESNVFELVDAIGRRESGRALGMMQDLMLRQSEPAQRLLAMIGRQFRLLLVAKDLSAARVPPAQMAAQLEAPAWRVRRLLEQSRYFSIPELEKALERALLADYAMKGGGSSSDITVMTQLVADLTAGS